MKKIIIVVTVMILMPLATLLPQSIVVGTSASIVIPSGADICAGSYGNISGNISGDGTQCTQTPVPVELTTFTAELSENNVLLEWTTESEVDNYGFEIERTIRSRQDLMERWETIEFIEGFGNSNSPKQYSHIDKNPMGGSVFIYRLKQIDTDGTYDYSNEIEIEIIPTEFALYQNYPNPFNPDTKIRYQLPVDSKVVMKLYDILGAEVLTLLNEVKEPGRYEVNFNAQNLPSGTYIYRFVTDDFVDIKKMVHMK
jgi:hypothetical protein